MADAATVTKLFEDKEKVVYHVTLLSSDGGGETETIIADKSTLVSRDGVTEPHSLPLLDLRASVQGFSKIALIWKHTSNVNAAVPASGNYMEDYGALSDGKGKLDTGSGSTGDLVLTTYGATSGASYDFTVTLRKA